MALPGLRQAAMGRVVLDLVVGLPRAQVAMGHPLVRSALLQAMHLCMWGCLHIKGCPARRGPRLTLWRGGLLCR